MKKTIVIGIMAATILMVGCGRKSSSAAAPAPGSRPVVHSDGSNTWYLGAMTIGGTNVPATNITIRVRTSEAAK